MGLSSLPLVWSVVYESFQLFSFFLFVSSFIILTDINKSANMNIVFFVSVWVGERERKTQTDTDRR